MLDINNRKLTNAKQRQFNKAKEVISAASCIRNRLINQKQMKTRCIKVDLNDKIYYMLGSFLFCFFLLQGNLCHCLDKVMSKTTQYKYK